LTNSSANNRQGIFIIKTALGEILGLFAFV